MTLIQRPRRNATPEQIAESAAREAADRAARTAHFATAFGATFNTATAAAAESQAMTQMTIRGRGGEPEAWALDLVDELDAAERKSDVWDDVKNALALRAYARLS